MHENLIIMQSEKVSLKATQIEKQPAMRLLNLGDTATYLHCGIEEAKSIGHMW
jgi:hypothetical protein